MPRKSHYRVVILGSGPAGLTATLYASRAELEPLVIAGGGGDDSTDVPGGQLMHKCGRLRLTQGLAVKDSVQQITVAHRPLIRMKLSINLSPSGVSTLSG